MFKVFFLMCLISGKAVFGQVPSIYDISIETLAGQAIKLDSFAEKKLIIIEFDPGNYSSSQLLTLDTIQRTNSQIQVIAVPAKDFSSGVAIEQIQGLVQSLNLSFLVTVPMFVRKTSGADQHPLFNWLTHVDKNSHFDNDADDAGQIYVIDGTGELYALLDKGTANTVLKDLANQ